MHRSSAVNKWKQSKQFQKFCYDFDVRWQQECFTFSLEEVLLWIMDTYFGQKRWFKVKKHLDDGFVYYKHADFYFTRHELMFQRVVGYLWIIVMFYQLFRLSFWRHPFTAEDPLVSKWHYSNVFQSVQINMAWRWRFLFISLMESR